MYKVKQRDLIGEVKDFPIEVVQKIAERQREQFVARNYKPSSRDIKFIQWCIDGDFDWRNSEEGNTFWSKVIHNKDFDLFFNRYPKTKK